MKTLPRITVYSFGKPKKQWQAPLTDYEQRLNKITTFEHIILKEKGHSEQEARRSATDELNKRIPKDSYVILLDETGKSIGSTMLANELALRSDQHVVFIIGSSYGVVKEDIQADRVLALSEMVLPHELARILLLEQLYRCHAILAGHPYHHGSV